LANAKGRVLTEPILQVKGYQSLWAAGDYATVPLSDGSMSPATTQFVLRQGTLLLNALNPAMTANDVVASSEMTRAMLYLCLASFTDLPTLFHESFLSLPALHPSADGGALGAGHFRRIGRKRPARCQTGR
jgi:NADH dehydrogenase FAD-containing subunit